MIEKIYKVTIFYDASWDKIEKIENLLLKLKTPISSHCFSGNPCAGPYYVAECKTLKQAEKVYNQSLRIIKRFYGKEEV